MSVATDKSCAVDDRYYEPATAPRRFFARKPKNPVPFDVRCGGCMELPDVTRVPLESWARWGTAITGGFTP